MSTVINCLDQIFTLCGMLSYIYSDQNASSLSQELKEYLSQRGIATSKTTPNHPIGNDQVERYNGIIWKAVRPSLKAAKLPDSKRELVFPDSLHSIRTLLSTSIICALMRYSLNFNDAHPLVFCCLRGYKINKNDPYVDEVQLMDANPCYAQVKCRDGREYTASLETWLHVPALH